MTIMLHKQYPSTIFFEYIQKESTCLHNVIYGKTHWTSSHQSPINSFFSGHTTQQCE